MLRTSFEDIEPQEMGWTPAGEAEITWSDGHRSVYSPALLRRICPCAECKGTHGGPPKAFHILSSGQVQGAPRQIIIEGVEPMGNYAICIHWGDGHKEGIYSWSMLRAECPCSECEERRRSTEESRS
ncbi:MAG: gamma-butyrobetaine hydroxylase-like domain-containing protein [Myxococcota bacterium]